MKESQFLPDDILFYLFNRYLPNGMFLINKRFNLEYSKNTYTSLNFPQRNVEINKKLQETLLFGLRYKYPSFIRILNVQLSQRDLFNDFYSIWRWTGLSHLASIQIQLYSGTEDQMELIDKFVVSVVEELAKLTKLTKFEFNVRLVKSWRANALSYVNNPFDRLSIKIAKLKHLKSLSFFEIPSNFGTFASFKTITSLEVNRCSYTSNYTLSQEQFPHVKIIKIKEIESNQISRIISLFPNAKSLKINKTENICNNIFGDGGKSSKLEELIIGTSERGMNLENIDNVLPLLKTSYFIIHSNREEKISSEDPFHQKMVRLLRSTTHNITISVRSHNITEIALFSCVDGTYEIL